MKSYSRWKTSTNLRLLTVAFTVFAFCLVTSCSREQQADSSGFTPRSVDIFHLYDRGNIAQIVPMVGSIFYYDKGYFNASSLGGSKKGSATNAGTISESGNLSTFALLTSGEIISAAFRADGTLWGAELLSNESWPEVYTTALVSVAGNRVTPRYIFKKNSGFAGSVIADTSGALWFTLSDAHSVGFVTRNGRLRTFAIMSRGKPILLTQGGDRHIYVSLDDKPWLLRCSMKDDRLIQEVVDSEFAKISNVRIATLTTSPTGTAWFTDVGHNTIDEVTQAAKIREVFVSSTASLDGSLAIDRKSAWFGTVTNLNRMSLASHTTTEVRLGQSFYGVADIAISQSGAVWAALNESQDSAGCFTDCSEIAKIVEY